MSFQHVTAPTGTRVSALLPADNGRPDRFQLMDALRKASPALKLKAPVLATLDALLSCLPPRRNHDFVFASNATLAFKRNGISDRTLRRHIAQLAEMGFLTRSDSPNRKRFSKGDAATGQVLRFGFDLAPLFAAYTRICEMAEACVAEASHLAFLRTKLRCAVARTLAENGASPALEAAQHTLRRKCDAADLEVLLAALVPVADFPQSEPEALASEPKEMTATGGQNDRHLQNSKKELKDSDSAEPKTPKLRGREPISLRSLVGACPEAVSYLQRTPEGPGDVVNHARTLAPMMGIDRATYHAAESRLGALEAAVTVWGLLEMQGKIRQIGAYFRALTTGAKSAGFDPWAFVGRLAQQRPQAAL